MKNRILFPGFQPLHSAPWLPKRRLLLAAFVGLSLAACTDASAPPTGSANASARARISADAPVIYVESNVPETNTNAVLAYRREGSAYEPLPGSPFLTGGAGVGNPTQKLGPDDSDQCLVFSEDKKRLFAVNSGSNTIAVFNINTDGSLTPVPGSPFPSGGINPVSLGVKENYLFVVNKNDDPKQPNAGRPNYTTFSVGPDGKLTPVPGSTFETTAKSSPSQAYVSPKKYLVFGADFLAFQSPTPVGTLRAFSLDGQGKLNPAPSTPRPIEGTGGALGLWAHPSANVLYVGFPLDGTIGVYGYDENVGTLTYKTKVKAGKAVCWLRVNKAGTRLYALVSGENAVTVYDLANPEAPALLQRLELKYPGSLYDVPGAGLFTTSEPFHEEFSPDGKTLYVVCQHTNPDLLGSGNYNYLHALEIAPDGKIAEPDEPYTLPVASSVRPQGVVIR